MPMALTKLCPEVRDNVRESSYCTLWMDENPSDRLERHLPVGIMFATRQAVVAHPRSKRWHLVPLVEFQPGHFDLSGLSGLRRFGT